MSDLAPAAAAAPVTPVPTVAPAAPTSQYTAVSPPGAGGSEVNPNYYNFTGQPTPPPDYETATGIRPFKW